MSFSAIERTYWGCAKKKWRNPKRTQRELRLAMTSQVNGRAIENNKVFAGQRHVKGKGSNREREVKSEERDRVGVKMEKR